VGETVEAGVAGADFAFLGVFELAGVGHSGSFAEGWG
jgi:hypothetical protein